MRDGPRNVRRIDVWRERGIFRNLKAFFNVPGRNKHGSTYRESDRTFPQILVAMPRVTKQTTSKSHLLLNNTFLDIMGIFVFISILYEYRIMFSYSYLKISINFFYCSCFVCFCCFFLFAERQHVPGRQYKIQ